MGSVFAASHVLIGRRVAVKVLRSELLSRPDLRACFLREARAVNWVNHPNIAEIYDMGEGEDGLVFLVMELLAGERLADRLDEGVVELEVALDVIEQMTAALARAHDLGVVHRDLKPEHVFLVERGGRKDFVKLIDFGLAYHAREGQAARGEVVGTPGYIAPEVLRGEPAGPAADLYALGVVFFEMLTGRQPFVASDPAALHELHRSHPVPNVCTLRPELPSEVGAVVARLLEKDPARRYGDAYRLLEDCRLLVRPRRPALDSSPGMLADAAVQAGATGNQALASSALKTALLGRMAASAYPGGGGPPEVERRVEELWGLLANLCRVEGELEVTESVLANARMRAREASDAVALEIAELSRHASRMARRIEGADSEVERLTRERREAGSGLRQLRRQIEAFEQVPGSESLPHLLHEAGVVAAHKQIKAEAIAKVRAKVERWSAEGERANQHADRLREQLRLQNQRLQSELARQELRVADLYAERALHLSVLDESVRWLRQHFGRRRECRTLIAELDRLAPESVAVEKVVSAVKREIES